MKSVAISELHQCVFALGRLHFVQKLPRREREGERWGLHAKITKCKIRFHACVYL